MKNILFLVLLCLAALYSFGQQKDSVRQVFPRIFNKTTGLAGYYFWQEDHTGRIDSTGVARVFQQNRIILEKAPGCIPGKTTARELQEAIVHLAHDQRWDPNNCYRFYRLFHCSMRKCIHRLQMETATQPSSILYYKRNGEWHTEAQRSVIYFLQNKNGDTRFSHSSDTITISEHGFSVPSNGLYEVYIYVDEQGKTFTNVYSYAGKNITLELLQGKTDKPIRSILFVNGYRGPRRDDDPGDGLITLKDRYYYWYKIDNRFAETLQPDTVFYVDGSFPVNTSNHRNCLQFGMSWLCTKLTPKKKTAPRIYKRLNTKSNPEGFTYRKEQGRLAGQTYLLARCVNPLSDTIKDTLDIVCHSMGYAYTLGFLDVVKDRFVLGNLYIMAPENASMEGFDWFRFQQVWQYGSNLDQPHPDPLREQDGIAPQCAVKGLDQLPPDRGGRAFFPPNWPNKNFVDSHMVYSYDWMFDCIEPGQPGYIHR